MTTTFLPKVGGPLYLTDSGLETTLIFHEGQELPYFAAFDLLKTEDGRASLKAYYMRHGEIALAQGMGFLMEGPTWRASADWGDKLGYAPDELAAANRASIELMQSVRDSLKARGDIPVLVSGCIGPRGDGYVAGDAMTAEAAHAYHQAQAIAFKEARADMIGAITMTNIPEATGVALAAKTAGIPVAISFTVETDGRLPSGDSLKSAVAVVDAATGGYPAYYMINCAHPEHFDHVLESGAAWMDRIGGMRANASRCSHAELDEAEDLDDGNPEELGQQYRALLQAHPQIVVLGGCCGTDHRHIHSIAKACVSLGQAA
ncbi:homocysteine S-methyltransferase family protein [Kordiimonas lacus]|uniref:Homocysteine S-methyltransferase n=1 Tax=Kordiimonas lacus TaxID=637679 RepID=A0A1G6YI26_9PROT|nr:homocysteine S-methyltransferase family protein [Kordiimonas lacus]SDD89377.1 homocysteine S-methyltransferase [Kordiimonas lacus]